MSRVIMKEGATPEDEGTQGVINLFPNVFLLCVYSRTVPQCLARNTYSIGVVKNNVKVIKTHT